ncbi:YafY family transcriptional regulator [Paenibacillus rhizovicinus]|uniref:YafY family transcriptional regulator n=1 Tax=Paenibacillus rhizovicinus TaxID=2704463 RepID=A0A6C0P1Y8_9BACL|nr:YafY family protein [Paenibacillus rhizovicinus]QHW32256.1 YafY family transcriptional regulator [Paenibacillus rhizovicinus]
MSKSKRLVELMMTVNRKRKFTVKELAREFGVSPRTILRDLQELGELGVPLYSEVGPHGGYQVLRERILPPIAFTEEEAVAIFFASHALRHFSSLPFETEASSALSKFYLYMSGDIRDRIDQMKNRFDYVTPTRQMESPYLAMLLDAAIHQKVIVIHYESKDGETCRSIQPIGIFAKNGLWYCPAYCFLRAGIRLFRCDRIHSADVDVSEIKPLDLRHVHLGNWESHVRFKPDKVSLYAELSKEGVQRCEAEHWAAGKLHTREDGTGWLEGNMPKEEIPYLAAYFLGLGKDVRVESPRALVEGIKREILETLDQYD